MEETIPNFKGEYAENYIAYYYFNKGFKVYKNINQSQIDLIIEKDNIRLNLQIKSAKEIINKKTNKSYFSFSIKRGNTKKIHYNEKIDFFCFVALEDERLNTICFWKIPFEEILKKQATTINIRENNSKYDIFKIV